MALAPLDPADFAQEQADQQDTGGQDNTPDVSLPMAQQDTGEPAWGDAASGAPTAAPPPPQASGGALNQAQAYVQAAQQRASQARQRVAQAQQTRDAYDPSKVTLPDDDGSSVIMAPQAPKPTSPLRDFARQVWAGGVLQGVAQPIMAAASQAASALGADPETMQVVEQTRADLANYTDSQIAKMSPAAQDAMRATLFPNSQGAPSVIGGNVSWSSYIGAQLAENIPTLTLAVVPGAVAGRAAVGLLGAAEAGTAASAATTGALFGTIDAGQAYDEFTKQVDNASHDEMMKSPAYQNWYEQAVQQGMTPAQADDQAKRQTVQAMGLGFGAAHFAAGAAAGVGIGGLLGRGIIGDATHSILRRAGIGALEGAATMGGQAAADNSLNQAENISAGTQQQFDPGQLATAVSSGAVGGALLGAAGGALHGRHVEGVQDDHTAALDQALGEQPELDLQGGKGTGLTEPLPPTGPGFEAGQEQGDLFSSSPTQPEPQQTIPPAPQPPTPPPPIPPEQRAQMGGGMEGVQQPELPLQGGAGSALTPDQGVALQQELPMAGGQMNTPAQPELPFEASAEQARAPIPGTEQTPQGDLFPTAEASAQHIAETAPPDTATMGRPALIQELTDSGVPKKGLAAKKLSDLRDMVTDTRSRLQEERAQQDAQAQTESLAQGDEAAQQDATIQGSSDEPAPTEDTVETPEVGSTPEAEGTSVPEGMDTGVQSNEEPTQPPAAQAIVDRAAARRAAQKARLAPPGERVRGRVETVEAPAEAPEDFAAGVTRAEQASAGAAPPEAPEGAPEAMSKTARTGTNVQRRAEGLLQDVLRGDKSAAEANDLMGTAVSKGRPRLAHLKDFASYIQSEIERAQDPARAQELLQRMKDEGANESRTTRQLREQTSGEYVQQLQRIHRELVDPAGAAADREAARQASRAKMQANIARRRAAQDDTSLRPEPVGIARASSRYVQAMDSDEANAPVARLLEEATRWGEPSTLHEGLRTIANNASAPEPARALATRLLQRVRDIPLVTHRGAREAGLAIPAEQHYGGAYMGTHVIVRYGAGGEMQTLLHEAVHAATHRYLDQLPANHPDMQLLRAMADEVHRQYQSAEATPTDRAIGAYDQDTQAFGDIENALLDPHEFVSEMMTSPSLQAFTAARMPSEQFMQDMRRLGVPTMAGSRSIWRRFTDFVRRAVGLPGAASGSEATLFDHIMSQTTGVMDRAFREQTAYERAVPDEVVRAVAEPLLRSTGTMFRDETARALERIDPAGINDRMRRGVLQASTLNDIVGWYRDTFQPTVDRGEQRIVTNGNPLVAFRDALEAIAHTSKALHDRYADQVNMLAQKLAGDEDLGRLMTDATTAQAKLGAGPNDNAHLTTSDQLTALRDLQARFQKLTPDQRETYATARDLYADMYRQERRAMLDAWVKAALPGADEDQVKAVHGALRNQKTLDAFLRDDTSVAEQFGTEWATNRNLVRGIAKVHALGMVKGDYFPLARYGDYLLSYGNTEEGSYGVEQFENRGAAEARRAELVKQGVTDVRAVTTRRQMSLSDFRLGNPAVEELMRAFEANPSFKGFEDDPNNVIRQLLLSHAASVQANQMRRRGIAGASIDQARTLAQNFLGFASRMGHLEHGFERSEALSQMELQASDIEKHPEDSKDAVAARAVLNEAKLRMASGDDAQNVLAGVARKLTNWSYVQSLMSFSHMLTSSVETHMNSTALIGARHGAKGVGYLAKAMQDIAPTMLAQGAKNTFKAMRRGLVTADWNLGDYARDRLIAGGANAKSMTDLFAHADAAGLIDHSQDRELRTLANPAGVATTRLGRLGARFMDLNSAGAHAVEAMNRAVVLKAAYDAERAKGGSHEQAVNYAMETLRKAAPNYNLSNKSRLATSRGSFGLLGPTMMQFKAYGLHMYGVMANLARASVNGPAKWENRKALAGILATHALMAGSLTLIADPLRYVMGAYDLATGASAPHDYQNDARTFLASAFGPELGEIAARGLPHALGFDISHRVGLADLLEIPGIDSFSKDDVMKALATAVTGATGENAAALPGAFMKLMNGDVMGAAHDAVPREVRDVMSAIRLNDQGVVDGRGNAILPASRISPWSVAVQAAGFQPSQVTEFREARAAEIEARQEQLTERQSIGQEFMTSPGTAMQRLAAYNNANPGARITMSDLLKMEQAQRARQNAVAGGQAPGYTGVGVRTSRANAPFLNQAGAFANVR